MDNQEAIRILELERDDWETSHCSPLVLKEAFNRAISALQAQESSQNVTNGDFILRKAAIDAIEQIYCHIEMIKRRPVTKGEQAMFLDMREAIKELPSAQPELSKNSPKLDKENGDLQQTCNQLATDVISRQAAIEAFGLSEKTRKYGGDHSGYDTMMLYEIQSVLEGLPSAQPERTEYIPDTKAVRSKRDCVDLAERVDATFYDQEYEEWTQKTVTIADVLDSVCDEYTILPSSQTEIIYCKDCEHFGVDRYKKLAWCSRNGYGYQADDFCSKAERRTDE